MYSLIYFSLLLISQPHKSHTLTTLYYLLFNCTFFFMFCRILIIHDIQVHTMTSEIIGGPLLNTNVSSPTKHQLGKPVTPPQFTPIKSLKPYMQEWTLKVRVLSKTDLRTFTNVRGPGHVFRFDVIDIACSEIRITCFNI